MTTYTYVLGKVLNGNKSNKFGLVGRGYANAKTAQAEFEKVLTQKGDDKTMDAPRLVKIEIDHKKAQPKKFRAITPKVAKAYFEHSITNVLKDTKVVRPRDSRGRFVKIA